MEECVKALFRRLWFTRKLLIRGGVGSGKSALLVAASRVQAEKQGGASSCFISLAAAGGDWQAAVLAALQENTGFRPGDRETVRLAFADFCTKHRGLILIDDLDAARDYDPAYSWLPKPGPHSSIVVSARDGRCARQLRETSGFSEYVIEYFSSGQKERLLSKVFSEYSKYLSREQAKEILSYPAVKTPLFLRIFAEELRQFGVYEKLHSRIRELLSSESVEGLFAKVLSRLAALKDAPPELLEASLAALLSARLGLTEHELLKVLSSSAGPIHQAHWSAIYLALRPYLLDNGGILSIAQQELKKAALQKYPRLQDAAATRARLAEILWDKRYDDRGFAELPWLILMIGDLARGTQLLRDYCWLGKAWVFSSVELKRFAAELANAGAASCLEEALAGYLQGRHNIADAALAAFDCLQAAKAPDSMAATAHKLVEKLSENSSPLLATALEFEAFAFERIGALAPALRALKRLRELIAGQDGTVRDAILSRRAGLLSAKVGQLDVALALLQESFDSAKRSGSHAQLMLSNGAAGSVLVNARKFNEAKPYIKEQLHLAAVLGSLEDKASGTVNMALVLRSEGRLDRAAKLLGEAELLYKAMEDKRGLALSLNNLAEIHLDRLDYDSAKDSLEAAYSKAEEIGDAALCADVMLGQAELYRRLGLQAEAGRCTRQATLLRERANRKNALQ
jgi:tetratricopeptide (TPR) repeat protein